MLSNRISRKIAALPIALCALAPSLVGVSTADAATATCAGQPATRIGTAGNDIIYGTGGRDVIVGLGGHDRIFGFGGDDIICGGSGNDEIDAGFGTDRVIGGNGNDRLRGGYGWDRIWGGNGNDWIGGGDGNDAMWGGNGHDDLYGGNGSDYLVGNSGNDRLAGQWGRDTVSGGWGEDLAVGENPLSDPDTTFGKQAVANVFSEVAAFCATGCIAGSATERSIVPVAGPAGVTFDRVQYTFDSEGFVLEMRLRDSSQPFATGSRQYTEISASGWLDAYGSPRSNFWGAYRTNELLQGASFSSANAAAHIQWILNRTY